MNVFYYLCICVSIIIASLQSKAEITYDPIYEMYSAEQIVGYRTKYINETSKSLYPTNSRPEIVDFFNQDHDNLLIMVGIKASFHRYGFEALSCCNRSCSRCTKRVKKKMFYFLANYLNAVGNGIVEDTLVLKYFKKWKKSYAFPKPKAESWEKNMWFKDKVVILITGIANSWTADFLESESEAKDYVLIVNNALKLAGTYESNEQDKSWGLQDAREFRELTEHKFKANINSLQWTRHFGTVTESEENRKQREDFLFYRFWAFVTGTEEVFLGRSINAKTNAVKDSNSMVKACKELQF